jgi:hypothetical protein
VPLIETVKFLVYGRAVQKRWVDYQYRTLKPDEQSYAIMEEFLFWVAVLHRQVC